MLLHQIFERTADSSPEAVAVVFASESLTYCDIEKRANRLSGLLRSRGIGHGDYVAMLLPRSADTYVSMLAILKAGAAYVPLDAEYPADRVAFILSDCRAQALVTTSSLADKATGFGGDLIVLDTSEQEIRDMSADRLCLPGNPAEVESDLCYIIYTSGTTGRPKGVQIEHRSVCHFVRTEGEIFRVQPQDRVYQGFTIAFDASIEEIWLAFFAGATLVAATQEMARAGPALPRMLRDSGVTVLSCVPTLLAMMDEDVPSLRLLILGGEVCPPELVKRWWKPERRIVNTYGPTEATVVATWGECHPDRPVTIGKPLPGYTIEILNDQLLPVASGEVGELCIGGIGLARGYIGRNDLTLEKFVELEQVSFKGELLRLYRTGDLARWTSDGEIEFLGRIDSQVKIRGYRVELGEIESVLLELPEIRATAVALREDIPGRKELAAYVVPRDSEALDSAKLRAHLQLRLPLFMVPTIFEELTTLPTLPSGKIDRKLLPPPSRQTFDVRREIVAARTPVEKAVFEVWSRLFAPAAVSVQDDFFLDLGGHSLLAARMVSELRRSPALKDLSMLDIYQHATIERLARKVEQGKGQAQDGIIETGANAELPRPSCSTNSLSHFVCGTAQLISLIFILSFFALQWLAPYLTYTLLIEEEYDFTEALAGAMLGLVAVYPLMLAVVIALKWLVIGRYREGSHPLWGAYYFRWWFVTTIEATVPVGYMAGTPLLAIYARLMGAKVGRNVHLGSENFAIYDLLSVGNDSSTNADSNLLGYTIEDGSLKLGRVTIGDRCFVGTRAAIGLGTIMEDDSALEDLSLLPPGTTIPRAQTWRGSPAKADPKPVRTSQSGSKPAAPSITRRCILGVIHAIGLLIFPVLVVAALFPGIILMNELNYLDPYYWYLLLAPLVALSFVVFLCLEIAALKWLLLGRIKPQNIPLYSLAYFRKWFFDQTLGLSLDVVGPLYASVYLTPWYKLLGAKLGRGTEISTASFISPDLLSLGDECFIADNVSLGAPRVRDGTMRLGTNYVGKRSFIGNSALLPPDTAVGESVLIGCLSVPPTDPAKAMLYDSSWLGSPALFLPQRQKSGGFRAEATFNPTIKLRAQRASIELARVILPSTGFIILVSLMFSAILLLLDRFSLLETLLIFPFLYLACGLTAAGFVIVAKWLLVGRYKPGERPLWSSFVWRNELLNALHEHLAGPFLLASLTGTPFVCWYFRLLGARIGKRVYMETTDLSEFDLVIIGDDATLNAECTIQTHLFEDRVMKMSTVRIGTGCKVGAGSLVLYDTQMEEGAALGDLSLLMKGEVLPRQTEWQGVPPCRSHSTAQGG